MLSGNLLVNIIRYTIPLMLSGILQLLFNAVDMIVVGRFSGPTSMAAVSSTGSLIALITNLFIGLSTGSSVVIARRLGHNDYDKITKAVSTSLLMAAISGIFLTVFGISMSHQFLLWMSSPADVIDLSTKYLHFYFTGMCATMVFNFGSAVLRAKGDTKRPLLSLIIAGVSNALLNLLFVTVFKMDVAGVGLASSISSYISAIMIVVVLIQEDGPTRLDLKNLHIDRKALLEIAKVGIPAGIQSCVFNISNVVIQSSINEFGRVVMAANGAASSIADFVYTTMDAFYLSCMTFTSQNIGAGKIKRVTRIVITCLILVSCMGLLTGMGSYYFGRQLLSIYADDPAVIETGMIRMSIVNRSYFICGIMNVLVGALRGMGSAMIPMIESLMGACAFRLIWIATYFRSHHTIDTLYISYPISWLITALVHLLTFVIIYKRLLKKNSRA